eukprot:2416170-Rhodomonas_salina.1
MIVDCPSPSYFPTSTCKQQQDTCQQEPQGRDQRTHAKLEEEQSSGGEPEIRYQAEESALTPKDLAAPRRYGAPLGYGEDGGGGAWAA